MERLKYNKLMFEEINKYSNGGAIKACQILDKILDELEVVYEMDRKQIVSLYLGAEQEFIEINAPKEGDILDLDFNRRYMVQVEFTKGDFKLTGKGMDAGGKPLSNYFFAECVVE